ncbi:MAG: hypothetical protein RLZZ517_633 [Candidatus Parcubacteria bacterium]|jgi:hypothetical protein
MPIESFGGSIESQKVENIQDYIKNTKTLEELYGILNSTEDILGTQGSYTGTELIQIIEAIKSKELPLESLTKTFGLRDKVYEILGDTVISSELEERKKFKDAVNSSNSFDELMEVLGDAQEYNITNDEYFNAQEAINSISLIKNKQANVEVIVPAYGLRDKVQELLLREVANEEVEEISVENPIKIEQVPSESIEKLKPEENKSLTVEEKQKIEERLEQIAANSEIINIQIQRKEAQIVELSKPKGNKFLNKVKGLFGFRKEDSMKNPEVELLIEEERQLAKQMDDLMRENSELLKKLQE